MLNTGALIRVRSPLLAKSRLISFPPATEMFHFTGFAPYKYGNMHHYILGCPIRTSTDQSSLTAPRSFSQSSTSFFASINLGIHHSPLSILPFILKCFTSLLNVLLHTPNNPVLIVYFYFRLLTLLT